MPYTFEPRAVGTSKMSPLISLEGVQVVLRLRRDGRAGAGRTTARRARRTADAG